MKTDFSFPKCNVLKIGWQGCAMPDQSKLNAAQHKNFLLLAVLQLTYECTSWNWKAWKSVSAWRFGSEWHLLTMSSPPWLHGLIVVKMMTEGKEATICRPPDGFPNSLGGKKITHSALNSTSWINLLFCLPSTKIKDQYKWRWLCNPGQKAFAEAKNSSLRWLILWSICKAKMIAVKRKDSVRQWRMHG